ncbi:MAG: hypothetical protein EOP00_19235 [Pedobacter sp.]|nr:MAG: hypothetical protein EOP00_19235 [Pedobacter sp.]
MNSVLKTHRIPGYEPAHLLLKKCRGSFLKNEREKLKIAPLVKTPRLGLCRIGNTYVGEKELFDRLVAKGKNKKPAIIAVANKLLKQVFGVVKNECLFDRNFYKKIA